MDPLIVIKDVTKVYVTGDVEVRALAGVSLTIESGEFVAIMGPSGSGKSTAMNIIGCLDVPSGGRYLYDGVDVGADQVLVGEFDARGADRYGPAEHHPVGQVDRGAGRQWRAAGLVEALLVAVEVVVVVAVTTGGTLVIMRL